MPVLKVLRGPASPPDYVLESDRIVLGRDSSCDVCLENDEVSRSHAEIVRGADGYCVVDLGSRNGTTVNHQPLRSGTPFPLRDRDLIWIGNFCLSFRDRPSGFWTNTPNVALERISIDSGLSADERSRFSLQLDSSSDTWAIRTALNPESKLKAIMTIARELHDTLSLDDVLARVVDVILRLFERADCAVLIVPDRDGGPAVPRVVKHRSAKHETRAVVIRGVIDHVMRTRRAVVREDVRTHPSVGSSRNVKSTHIRSLMCAPLLDRQGRSLGVIQLDTRRHRYRFTEEDLDLLTAVATQVSWAIEVSRLHTLALMEAELQQEMELAREIQMRLLPSSAPRLDGYDFFNYYSPARHVGGDCYDYLALPDGRWAIVLGDVSGKGVPAALVMANLSTELRIHLSNGLDPVEVMLRINADLPQRSPLGNYVTMVLLLLDPIAHQFTIVNAGHWRPLLRSANGGVYEIGDTQTGLPLGVSDDTQYQQCIGKLEPGDAVVLFSDGLLDATNARGETYQLSGIRSRLLEIQGTAPHLGRKLIDSVLEFAGDCPQVDDMCLLCLTRRDEA